MVSASSGICLWRHLFLCFLLSTFLAKSSAARARRYTYASVVAWNTCGEAGRIERSTLLLLFWCALPFDATYCCYCWCEVNELLFHCLRSSFVRSSIRASRFYNSLVNCCSSTSLWVNTALFYLFYSLLSLLLLMSKCRSTFTWGCYGDGEGDVLDSSILSLSDLFITEVDSRRASTKDVVLILFLLVLLLSFFITPTLLLLIIEDGLSLDLK